MLSTDQLLELYKVAVDEYHFEVKLNWDRTVYYMVFNSAVVSIATGLLKLDNPPVIYLFVGAIYLVGLCSAGIGIQAIRKGHEYYRRTIVQKTVLEDVLTLTRPLPGYPAAHNLSLSTTVGQGEHEQILHDPEGWINRPLRKKAITTWVVWILALLAAINASGMIGAVWLYEHPKSSPNSQTPTLLPIGSRRLPV